MFVILSAVSGRLTKSKDLYLESTGVMSFGLKFHSCYHQ